MNTERSVKNKWLFRSLLVLVLLFWWLRPYVPAPGFAGGLFESPPASSDPAWVTDPSSGGRGLSLLYSPDGATLAVRTDAGIELYDAGTLEPLLRIESNSALRAAAFSPDGATLALALEDETIEMRSVASGDLLRSFTGQGFVHHVAFDPAGSRLFSAGSEANSDESVRVWSVASGALLRTIPVPLADRYADLTGVAYHPDGDTFAATSTEGTLRLYRIEDGMERGSTGKPFMLNPYHYLRYIDTGFSYRAVAFSPDGALVAASDVQGVIWLWNVQDGRLLRSLEAHGAVRDLAFATDTLLATDRGEVIDISILRRDRRFSDDMVEPLSVAFSPDGDRIAVLDRPTNEIGIWKLSDGDFLSGLRRGGQSASP